jgi:hypothetical protein
MNDERSVPSSDPERVRAVRCRAHSPGCVVVRCARSVSPGGVHQAQLLRATKLPMGTEALVASCIDRPAAPQSVWGMHGTALDRAVR